MGDYGVNTFAGSKQTITVDKTPNECPFCHYIHVPQFKYGQQVNNKFVLCFMCSNQKCGELYLAYYVDSGAKKHPHNWKIVNFDRTSRGIVHKVDFSDEIKEISDKFVKTYNQAFLAEEEEMDEICGPGYRKALEYLLKDYLIKKRPNKEGEIRKSMLGQCINTFIDDKKIKDVAKRAAWLGNDETHYERRWVSKDLENLKVFIDLIVKWIEESVVYEKMLVDMPDPKEVKG